MGLVPAIVTAILATAAATRPPANRSPEVDSDGAAKGIQMKRRELRAVQLFEEELSRRKVLFSRMTDGRYLIPVPEGKLEVSLDNLKRDFASDEDEGRIKKFVDVVVSQFEEPKWPDAKRHLYWDLESSETEIGDALARPVSKKVVRVLALARPDESSYALVTPDLARSWHQSQAQLEREAGANLDRLLVGIEPQIKEIDGMKLGILPVKSVFKVSVIFAPGFRAFVADKIGWPALAVIPHRDFIYVISEKDRALLNRMGGVVQREFRQGAYPLTTEVFRISDEGVEAIGAFPE